MAGLTAAERIKRRPEFEAIYKQGARMHSRSFTVFVLATDRPHARFGVAATRKLGDAVVRNRAKRLARELFRRHKPSTGLDIVIVPRREMLDAPFESLESEYRAVLDRRSDRRPRPTTRGSGRQADARPAEGL